MNGIDDPLVGDQKGKRMMIEEGRMVIKRERIESVKEKEGDLGGGVLWRRKRAKRDPRRKGKGEDDQEGIGSSKGKRNP